MHRQINDEVRRITANIARLPELLRVGHARRLSPSACRKWRSDLPHPPVAALSEVDLLVPAPISYDEESGKIRLRGVLRLAARPNELVLPLPLRRDEGPVWADVPRTGSNKKPGQGSLTG